MFTKFKTIKNLAVFKDFNWDTSVRDKIGNNIILFKRINILYGRNYSGKTTLSRIVRALETGHISDKYENPECCVCVKDNSDVNNSDFNSHNKTIRVFNQDFIEENLKFIVNPNENVEPFAILGEDNNEIEKEIELFKKSLGSNEADSETGLYQELKSLKAIYQIASKAHTDAQTSLDSQLGNKATGRPKGIKYQSKYGEINYDIRRLKADIGTVKKATYTPLTIQEESEAENILKEQSKNEIPELTSLNFKFSELHTKAKEIIAREIGQSNKIEALVKDAVLNRWVREGKNLHQDKFDVCSFCNNTIDENRWRELDRHFDEESDQLEKDINALLSEIKSEKTLLNIFSVYKKEQVYSKFHKELETTKKSFDSEVENYSKSLTNLEIQLENRKKDILNNQIFIVVPDLSLNIEDAIAKLDKVRIKSNEYSDKLDTDQDEAKEKLRLKEVHDFIVDIKYDDLITHIAILKLNLEAAEEKRNLKQGEIDNIILQISSKQKELKDESKGAEKVNEYLNNHFGHDFLTLKAIEFEDEVTGEKSYRFEIHRVGKKAFHLSEGEKSLIAFCYFVAKLHDVNTKNNEPIIWIDDPISSLDNNHIFFIYSLIKSKIYNTKDFEQMFISTHDLNFLKYLQRLPSHNDKKDNKVEYFIIERVGDESSILELPNYIKRNVTEFNHLFKQIFECSKIENVTDENYTLFYNFGNNTRKFLEIYLFYKYPDSSDQTQKMKKFFGVEEIPIVLTDRINNEYSHLVGVFERGQSPVEVPEMKKASELIVKKLKEKDEEQYNALLSSVGLEE
jgi:wobble nucleotide-excising tRNase